MTIIEMCIRDRDYCGYLEFINI
ncbi:hypothetical protein A5865_000507, partial [Enterococcus sp. 12E11_DIV0728]